MDDLPAWSEPPVRAPALSGRVSATDRLSWWFRPAAASQDPWAAFFETAPAEHALPAQIPAAALDANDSTIPLGRRAALRMLLAEPDEELLDADADEVVTCLYDFVHAIGRGDIDGAVEQCVAPDYHAMEDDVEIDRDGLAAGIRAELGRLSGWTVEASLVEIPEPIPHPDGILVLTELQLDARKDDLRQTILHRRLALFRQGRDRQWRIAALSSV